GTTTLTCTATDGHGNSSSGPFTVTVRDTTPPALALPANITVEATGPAGAVVTYGATANDIFSGALPVTCTPPSGTTFAVGLTTVGCSATDASANVATGSFTVTVMDTAAPTVMVPADVTAEATGPSGTTVTYSATAADLVDGTLAVTCAPASGTRFFLGATTVSCSATDRRGNTGSARFTITVVDTTPPTLSLPAHITAEATGPTGATVIYVVSATDL